MIPINNKEIGQRIASRREEIGLTMDDIASEIGVARSTIQRYEKGSIEKVKLPIIEAIARVMSVNPEWIVGKTDKKELLDLDTNGFSLPIDISDAAVKTARLYDAADDHSRQIVDLTLAPFESRIVNAPQFNIRKTTPPPKRKPREDGFEEITVYEDGLPAAGYSSYFDTPSSHIEQYPFGIIPPSASFAVPISGDSMEPEYKDHSTVFVQSTPRVENGEIGLFSLNGEPYIKQLVVDNKNREIRLHSLNSSYSDIKVAEFDDLRVFGKVLGSYFI